MRVLVVSAHYPPNFISGGTLGPQRIARGLHARGHDVSVYAGWLGDRPPLDAWADVDDVGIPVRWISITPWIDWSNRRNFDNPDVATDFRLHLEDIRPDVVHVHSLQTLGVGVVQAAVEHGARVVVTMHDFWWLCGRQFLCDRELRPCSLVVECGMCHCEVNREWLRERTETVLAALHGVDQILAVSESSAAVLRANGVGLNPAGPDLVVDENGLPPLETVARRRLTGDDVVFLYTGGSEQLKGVDTVLKAAHRLADCPGWRLHAYGIEQYLTDRGVLAPERVVVLPRFTPDEAGGVFDMADVLVLPSVVRESHSLVTREALARGMSVITSDTLGPEEVVQDRVNGVVVPAGDADQLAEAMRAIVEDCRLRESLAVGALEPIALRPLEDQIDDIARRFEDLVRRRPRTRRPADRRIRRVLFVAGIDGAPLRYRAHFAAEALALHEVETWVRHYRSADVAALAAFADAVVIYRVPATNQILGLISTIKARGAPVFFDVDDLIFDPDLASEIPSVQALPDDERGLYLQGVERYRTTLEACDAYIGSTQMLVDRVAELGIPAHRWWNGVGTGIARCSDAALAAPRGPGPLRIGYMSGTRTHDHDWRFVEPAVAEVLEARPDCELWLGGLVAPTKALDRFGARIRRIELKPWWELPWVLRDLDVNLAPLEPESAFNEAKSAIKWLEAALSETATVATPTRPFCESIDDGRTGRLASTPAEFRDAILELLDDDHGRTRMGRLARRSALLEWSPHLQGRRYLDILEHGTISQGRTTRWNAVTLDEPWMDLAIEGYVAPDPMVLAPIKSSAPAPAEDAVPAGTRGVRAARRIVRAARHAANAAERRLRT